jgi:hypothetical protein
VALDVAGFRAAFPEFGPNVSDVQIEARLGHAKLQVSASVWGARADLAVGYLTAHLLAMDVRGQPARLVPTNAKASPMDALTTYERLYRELARTTPGSPVVG